MSGRHEYALTRDQIIAEIGRVVRRRLGPDADASDVLRRQRDGQLPNWSEVIDALVLADLLPEDDPIFDDP